MARKVIDADGHVVERDIQLYPYLEEPYRGKDDLLSVSFFPSLDGWHRAARRIADRKGRSMPSPDAKTWCAFLDDANVEASVLYPTNGLGYGLVKDKEWAGVLARAYNNFLHTEYLKPSSGRLKGIALIPLQDIAEAVKELRRAVTELGMVGAILPAVGLRRPLGEAYYDPVYAEAQALGCMLAVHGAPAQGLGFDFFERLVEARVLSHPFAQMIQLTSIVMNGVLERFPRLRLSFMEAGAGWIPFMLERLDRECRNRAADLQALPSEQLRSDRIFFHCELDEQVLPDVIARVGAEHFFCASDFPHESTQDFIEGLEAFWKRPDLPESAKAKILYDNPRRLYRL
ncbi:MAG: amidohydrolase [Deltaproteobacteria bacterium]|nr:amidohydrolase [Deltaproteobacteria bacterium]